MQDTLWTFAIYALLGLLSLGESLFLVGLALPATAVLIILGFFSPFLPVSLTGMLLSMGLGAWLGQLFSVYWRRHWPLPKHWPDAIFAQPIRHLQIQIERSETLAWLEGRFRVFGRGGMPYYQAQQGWPRILGFSLLGAVLWLLVYGGSGYLLGYLSFDLFQGWARLLPGGVVLVAVGALLAQHIYYLIRMLVIGLRQAMRWLRQRSRVRRWSEQHPWLDKWVYQRFDKDLASGLLLTVGLLLMIAFGGLFASLAGDVVLQGPLVRIDQILFQQLQMMHTDAANRFFIFMTHLGNPLPSTLFFIALIMAFLIMKQRDEAFFYGLGFLGGELFVGVLKYGFNRQRPEAIHAFYELHTPSFPSGHTFTALLIPGLLLFFVARGQLPLWLKKVAGICVVLYCALMGLSRMYLGVHWFSDIVGAVLACLVWVAVIGTAYEYRRKRKQRLSEQSLTRWRIPLAIGSVMLILGVNLWLATLDTSPVLAKVQDREVAPRQFASLDDFKQELPLFASDLLGHSLVPIQVMATTNAEPLESLLRQMGFRPLAAQTYLALLNRQQALQGLPLYLDGLLPDQTWLLGLGQGRYLRLQQWSLNQEIQKQRVQAITLEAVQQKSSFWGLNAFFPDDESHWSEGRRAFQKCLPSRVQQSLWQGSPTQPRLQAWAEAEEEASWDRRVLLLTDLPDLLPAQQAKSFAACWRATQLQFGKAD